MPARKQERLKDGTRRRPTGKTGRGGGMPRIMWLAILVCIVGAVFLFRTQGGDMPAGIGENQTVVTAPEVDSNLAQDTPRSGDVDINAATQPIVPEADKSADKAGTAATPAEQPVTKPATNPAASSSKPAETAAKPTPAPAKPAPASIKPVDSGPYVVQIGSFGQADNADKEAQRLHSLGWDALVKVGNTSDGQIIYRVRIGYFTSRSQAETFIRQNRNQMQGAIAVHR